MSQWPADGMQLEALEVGGAMQPSRPAYLRFVESNRVLSPNLHTFVVYYTMANPALVDNKIIQALTRRYAQLKQLEIGSCCGTVTDDAFKYLTKNSVGIEAGLKLEKIYLCC